MTEIEVVSEKQGSAAVERGTIVWVDDFIDSLSHLADELERMGFSVIRLKSFDEVESYKTNVKYYIFDEKIKRDVDAGRRYVRSGRLPMGSKVILYSGQIDIQYFSKPVQELDNSVIIKYYLKDDRSNDLGSIQDTCRNFARFFELVNDDEESGYPLQANSVMSFSEYQALPFELQADFNENFFERNRETILQQFDDGVVWAAWFEDGSGPDMYANSIDDIPDDAAVERRARELDKPALVFRTDIRLDDTADTICSSASRDVSSYPVAKMDLGDQSRRFHFDPGADTTYMNHRFASEINAKMASNNVNMIIHNRPVTGKKAQFTATVDLYDDDRPKWFDERSGTRTISVSGYAIARWARCPLVVKCGPKCVKDQNEGSELCAFRADALIGRSVLSDNALLHSVRPFSGRSTVFFLREEANDEPDGGGD